MRDFLKRLFWLTPVHPVTHNDVAPAARPVRMAQELKDAQSALVGEIMAVERRSSDIRIALADKALKFVSGD